ncbi:MAG: DUF4430 domain-containing protein [Eubacteriales bacterium]|nr:DUF4430 domain-containing protein [Eubacteriales bacterium]MDD4474880.1 DUF4430 domain-containing protein [Eubacteriales bacterium]
MRIIILGRKKDILIIFLAILLIAVLVHGVEIQSVEEYYLTHIDDINSDSETVTLSIDCSSILENYDKLDKSLRDEKFVPEDGIILPKTRLVLRQGDTAFDVLNRATKKYRIHMEYQGADLNAFSSVYIKGINYIYEFSCGETSGWTYLVNGLFPDQGISQYKLKDGDVLELIYSCELNIR